MRQNSLCQLPFVTVEAGAGHAWSMQYVMLGPFMVQISQELAAPGPEYPTPQGQQHKSIASLPKDVQVTHYSPAAS